MRSLIVVLACGALCLIVTACGGSSFPSATPTPTAVQTAAPTSPAVTNTAAPATATAVPTNTRAPGANCLASDLIGAFVHSDGTAGSTFYQLGVTNVSGTDCVLSSPPALRFENAAGADLGMLFSGSAACPAGGPYDLAACVDYDVIDLPPGGPTPADSGSAPGQVTVVVGVKDIGALPACSDPHVMAHTIGVVFAEAVGDVTVKMPADIELQTCVGQARLQGYGPSLVAP